MFLIATKVASLRETTLEYIGFNPYIPTSLASQKALDVSENVHQIL